MSPLRPVLREQRAINTLPPLDFSSIKESEHTIHVSLLGHTMVSLDDLLNGDRHRCSNYHLIVLVGIKTLLVLATKPSKLGLLFGVVS